MKSYPFKCLKHSGVTCFLLLAFLFLFSFCSKKEELIGVSKELPAAAKTMEQQNLPLWDSIEYVIPISRDVKIKNYFSYLDSLVLAYDSLVPYALTEHLLVQANPWVIDTLVNTDYYYRMSKGEFVYDQKELVVLAQGDSLCVPAINWAARLIAKQDKTLIDINIPEYKLRILEDGRALYQFSIRVGQNRARFLKTAGRIENLRTRTGSGIIHKIKRNPRYMNPVDGQRYKSTLRDDGRRTLLPQIPFLHPEINGHRWGQLIHPTTNPETLGKAYSNGCIGTKEGEAWRIYYHAPVGTDILIRYDLQTITEEGDTLNFDPIYPGYL